MYRNPPHRPDALVSIYLFFLPEYSDSSQDVSRTSQRRGPGDVLDRGNQYFIDFFQKKKHSLTKSKPWESGMEVKAQLELVERHGFSKMLKRSARIKVFVAVFEKKTPEWLTAHQGLNQDPANPGDEDIWDWWCRSFQNEKMRNWSCKWIREVDEKRVLLLYYNHIIFKPKSANMLGSSSAISSFPPSDFWNKPRPR